jgi:hypothetical protein
MEQWPKNPTIYEINSWVWLQELSERHGKSMTLGTTPEAEWDLLCLPGVDALWLMGVWERSPAGALIANSDDRLRADFERVLPDYSTIDNVGSPYCVKQYVVDEHLGGPAGLAKARSRLAERGVRLILDYVPNHVAPDHPWVFEHPEYFIQGDGADLSRDPGSFVAAGGNVLACGKDPYSPPWPDVLQLNAFNEGLRRDAIAVMKDIADQCDGVRCDMAMLFINYIFNHTWGQRAGVWPSAEYWTEVIGSTRNEYPDFLFIAEAYWNLEWDLQERGFNYCYDKRLYDRVGREDSENVRVHLSADLAYQNKLVRFIENHDESRAAARFSFEEECAASIATATLPGARLFHEGQFEGRKVKVPVFLKRRPPEKPDRLLQEFYRRLLDAVSLKVFRSGLWQLCERTGWPDNASYLNLITWCWQKENERYLIVVNLSGLQSQGLVVVPWPELRGRAWQLLDVFAENIYQRDGDELCDPGLYVDLGPWEFHFLRFF